MCYVYVIKSLKNGKFYTGCTRALEKRLLEHHQNKTRSLKNKGPFELIFRESHSCFTNARKRELQIKKFKGGRAFKQLIGILKTGDVV